MAAAVVLALVIGLAIGVAVGRRMPAAEKPAPSVVVAPAPSKKAIKAGLSENAFVPSDDILEKLRLAAEGKLDPAALREAADEAAAELARRPDPEPRPELTEAERRVLDRLRDQEPGSSSS